MTWKKRGCLLLLGFGVAAVIGVVVAVKTLVPGDLRLGGGRRPSPSSSDAGAPVRSVTVAPSPLSPSSASPGESPANPAPLPGTNPMPGGTGSAVDPVQPVAPSAEPERSEPAGGLMTYLVPEDILQSETSKAFPIRFSVYDLVRLQLSNPVFVRDPDPAYLRLRLNVEARVVEGNQSLPAVATVRTQLRYDRSGRRVMLSNAQLVEFSFGGGNAALTASLQPVLAAALASEMQGYVIFEVPQTGLWWLKVGVSWIRDVYVEDHRVALVLGP